MAASPFPKLNGDAGFGSAGAAAAAPKLNGELAGFGASTAAGADGPPNENGAVELPVAGAAPNENGELVAAGLGTSAAGAAAPNENSDPAGLGGSAAGVVVIELWPKLNGAELEAAGVALKGDAAGAAAGAAPATPPNENIPPVDEVLMAGGLGAPPNEKRPLEDVAVAVEPNAGAGAGTGVGRSGLSCILFSSVGGGVVRPVEVAGFGSVDVVPPKLKDNDGSDGLSTAGAVVVGPKLNGFGASKGFAGGAAVVLGPKLKGLGVSTDCAGAVGVIAAGGPKLNGFGAPEDCAGAAGAIAAVGAKLNGFCASTGFAMSDAGLPNPPNEGGAVEAGDAPNPPNAGGLSAGADADVPKLRAGAATIGGIPTSFLSEGAAPKSVGAGPKLNDFGGSLAVDFVAAGDATLGKKLGMAGFGAGAGAGSGSESSIGLSTSVVGCDEEKFDEKMEVEICVDFPGDGAKLNGVEDVEGRAGGDAKMLTGFGAAAGSMAFVAAGLVAKENAEPRDVGATASSAGFAGGNENADELVVGAVLAGFVTVVFCAASSDSGRAAAVKILTGSEKFMGSLNSIGAAEASFISSSSVGRSAFSSSSSSIMAENLFADLWCVRLENSFDLGARSDGPRAAAPALAFRGAAGEGGAEMTREGPAVGADFFGSGWSTSSTSMMDAWRLAVRGLNAGAGSGSGSVPMETSLWPVDSRSSSSRRRARRRFSPLEPALYGAGLVGGSRVDFLK